MTEEQVKELIAEAIQAERKRIADEFSYLSIYIYDDYDGNPQIDERSIIKQLTKIVNPD